MTEAKKHQRISDAPVIDRTKQEYQKKMIFLDKEGFLCMRDMGGPKLTPEQKAKRQEERRREQDKILVYGKRLQQRIKDTYKRMKSLAKEMKYEQANSLKPELAKCKKEWQNFKSLKRKEKLKIVN